MALFWFGPTPEWADKFAERVSHSKTIQMVLIGECAGSMPELDAVRVHCTYDQFEDKASQINGVEIRKKFRERRGAELRPLLADVFRSAFEPFDWWGYCDWDTCWGDWDSFLTDERLAGHDMIAGNNYCVNGPWSIFRNTPETTQLYRKGMDLVSDPKHRKFDEWGIDAYCRIEYVMGRMRLCYPHDIQCHDRMDRWNQCTLIDGKLFRMDGEGNIGGEIMYFHFPGTKRWPLAS